MSDTVTADPFKALYLRLEKIVRYLQQHAGTIASLLFGAARTPMIEVQENLKSILDKVMTGTTLQFNERANTTTAADVHGVE